MVEWFIQGFNCDIDDTAWGALQEMVTCRRNTTAYSLTE
jgi:hypothetical protein